MNEVIVKSKATLAVKRALKGSTTGMDMAAIVQFQMRELGEIDIRSAAQLVLYSAAFN